MWQRGRMTAAFRLPTISTMSTKVAARSRIGAPAMPAAPGELRKAQASRRRRQKDSYGLLTKHLLHKEHLQHITQNFFQDGRGAYNYLDTALSQVTDQIRLDAMDQQWIDLNILMDVGVHENTIKSLVIKLKALNDERPTAPVNHRKSANEMGTSFVDASASPAAAKGIASFLGSFTSTASMIGCAHMQ